MKAPSYLQRGSVALVGAFAGLAYYLHTGDDLIGTLSVCLALGAAGCAVASLGEGE